MEPRGSEGEYRSSNGSKDEISLVNDDLGKETRARELSDKHTVKDAIVLR